MQYNFSAIEDKWQKKWQADELYKVTENSDKPKCYVLDMFPYPSGSGLHVGHPLGYIASDIYARYKRLKGFNVLHPMGFDAFGLPAEQYAVETGQHPVKTTEENIARYKEQLAKIGFSYDWSREVKTADPNYYKWTQWIFLQLFNSYYDEALDKAQPISKLTTLFEKNGSKGEEVFSAEEWKNFSPKEKEDILMNYRLAYRKTSYVNWCEQLGTVLANDEVVNGVSERGGHPVEKKEMMQWFLRISKYADRLLQGLEIVDFPEPLKDMQRNWIGKSQGAIVSFNVSEHDSSFDVFTTRPDTIFGTSFLVLAPEHELVSQITTTAHKEEIEAYVTKTSKRSERDRMAETKNISGCFTGAYALHPITKDKLPIWIADYVLAHYGTGAIMAVPAGDDRDFAFANRFNISIPNIFEGVDVTENACSDKSVSLMNSDFLNGTSGEKAIEAALLELEKNKTGFRKINYKMRDAGFSRQRYWGEPFPIRYNEDGSIAEESLPHLLPQIDSYDRGPEGKGPLAHLTDWVNVAGGIRETDTMPGYAGSSWYYLRYMDPQNSEAFCSKENSDYWNQVDLYVGGAEHAVGHLLYSRFWCKVLHDLDYISYDEPYKKLINQGMIQGKGFFCDRVIATKLVEDYYEEGFPAMFERPILMEPNIELSQHPQFKKLLSSDSIDANLNFELNKVEYRLRDIEEFVLNGNILYEEKYKEYISEKGELSDYDLTVTRATVLWNIDENGRRFIKLRDEIEKMSKSKYNVFNPDEIIEEYGADTFRMYEMFLGPIEDSKPWDTKGIEGVHRFLKKLWRLYYTDEQFIVEDTEPTKEALKVLHQTIEKVEKATESFSLNTAVSQFMICVNELTQLKCNSKSVLEQLLVLLAPYAPHITDELYQAIGNNEAILNASYPVLDKSLLVEDELTYPIAINGKRKMEIQLSADIDQNDAEEIILANQDVQKLIEGKTLRKFIFVKGRMINLVV